MSTCVSYTFKLERYKRYTQVYDVSEPENKTKTWIPLSKIIILPIRVPRQHRLSLQVGLKYNMTT